MKKMVWARSSRHLFIHPTVIAQICSQFYHGMLLNMKKMQAPSSNSPQPLPQGRIYWTKVGRRLGKRYSLSLWGPAIPPNCSQIWGALIQLTNPCQPLHFYRSIVCLYLTPFLQRLSRPLYSPQALVAIRTFWHVKCVNCPFSLPALCFRTLCLVFIFKDSRGSILL